MKNKIQLINLLTQKTRTTKAKQTKIKQKNRNNMIKAEINEEDNKDLINKLKSWFKKSTNQQKDKILANLIKDKKKKAQIYKM